MEILLYLRWIHKEYQKYTLFSQESISILQIDDCSIQQHLSKNNIFLDCFPLGFTMFVLFIAFQQRIVLYSPSESETLKIPSFVQNFFSLARKQLNF